MNLEILRPIVSGRKALVVGLASDRSIAWGGAKAFHELGAPVALTYLNDKARPRVERRRSARQMRKTTMGGPS
jgi:enoyl-[acyl-carrier protein] reductase I